MPSENTQPKKSGPAVGIILFILVIGGAAAGLHFTGKLQPILDIVMGTPTEKPLPPVIEIIPTPDRPKMPDPVVTKVPDTGIIEKPVGHTVEPVRHLTEEEKLVESFRKRFKAPVVGKPISVEIKGKSKQSGVLTYIDERAIKLKTDKMEMTLARSQLAPKGLARCYEEEYIKYMMGNKQSRDRALALQKKQIAKLNASYAKFMASRGKKVDVAAKTTSKASVQNMDFKQWMEDNGQTEALKARQDRIRAYEAEKRAAQRSK
jgi:hypothetical protein